MANSTLTLDEVHGYFVQEYIPIICVFSLAGVIGIVGNILTIVFYDNSRACSTNTLIITLAWMDLFVCVTSFGFVAELYLNVLFTNQIFCSTLHVLLYLAFYASIMTLWVISKDRYSKLCRPLRRQLSIKKAKIVAIVYFCIAAVLSLRTGFTHKIVNVSLKIPGQEFPGAVTGHWCSNSPDNSLGIIVRTFHIFDAVCVIVICLTLVITYSRIMHALISHHKELRHVSTRSTDNEQTHEEKPKSKNERKLSDNDKYKCNVKSETVSEFPTTSLNVSDISVHRVSPSQHTTDNESSTNNMHSVVEKEIDTQIKQIQVNGQLSSPKMNVVGSMKSSIDKVHAFVTEEKAVQSKRVHYSDAEVSPESEDTCSNDTETSTSTLNSFEDKLNGVQKARVHEHEPDDVDEELRDPRAKGTKLSQTPTSHKGTNQNKRWKTRVNIIKRSERRVTLQMLAASVAFLCCFLPYMVMRFTQSNWQHFDENDFSVELWIPFLLPIVNSVINPILYSILNQRYRMFVKGCVRKILFCGICKAQN